MDYISGQFTDWLDAKIPECLFDRREKSYYNVYSFLYCLKDFSQFYDCFEQMVGRSKRLKIQYVEQFQPKNYIRHQHIAH